MRVLTIMLHTLDPVNHCWIFPNGLMNTKPTQEDTLRLNWMLLNTLEAGSSGVGRLKMPLNGVSKP